MELPGRGGGEPPRVPGNDWDFTQYSLRVGAQEQARPEAGGGVAGAGARAARSHQQAPGAGLLGTTYMPERKERMCFLCLLKMIPNEGPCLLAGASLTPLCQKMIFHRC